MSDHNFALGWRKDLHLSNTRKVAAAPMLPGAILPAFSLSKFRFRHLEQGQVGTCWEHAPTQAFEILTGADGTYEPVPLCRNLVGYQGTILMAQGGRRDNPADGGIVSDGFLAMGDAPQGVGVCHEDLWPYHDDPRSTGAAPPAGVLADAAPNRVHQVAAAPRAQWQSLIQNGHPCAIGIDWPAEWDSEGQTFFDRMYRSVGGHALCVMGWMTKGSKLYWQLDNWHGLLYAPLSEADAATVPGYKPIQADKTSDFWVLDQALASAYGGQGESTSCAGLTGFKLRPKLWDFKGFA